MSKEDFQHRRRQANLGRHCDCLVKKKLKIYCVEVSVRIIS